MVPGLFPLTSLKMDIVGRQLSFKDGFMEHVHLENFGHVP